MSNSQQQFLVGEYLLRRVKELGVKSLFGVPGDYELALLDLVLQSGLEWKGNPNELIAAYAADGYARVNGVGALVTTFGPGETSALCGIAGAYTEFVPVVHIVGYPSVRAQHAHAILHHTLGEGKFNNYHDMSKQICCATTVLKDAATAASEIDRVLNAMLLHSQPVYIGIPTDVAFESISSVGLLVPLTTTLDPNNAELEDRIVAEIRVRLDGSRTGVIVVDGGAARHRVLPEVAEIIKVSGWPVYTTPMGKGTVDEDCGQYGGTYVGAGSKKDVVEAIEKADCVLRIGNYPADLNTGEFTTHIKQDVVIDFDRFHILMGRQKYNLKMKFILARVIDSLKAKPLTPRHTALAALRPFAACPSKPTDTTITQSWFWPRLSNFLAPKDLIIIETGTAASGFTGGTRLPPRTTMWTQEIFGSIGYATGAMVGASKAHNEKKKESQSGSGNRSVLVTGDGSLQLTVQALADLLRNGTHVHVFVLNNDGYTVERLIHGREQPYNDIPMWAYTKALGFFGPQVKSESYLVRTPDELEKLLDDPEFGKPTCTKLVEVIMDKFDGPQALIDAGAAIDRFNAGKY